MHCDARNWNRKNQNEKCSSKQRLRIALGHVKTTFNDIRNIGSSLSHAIDCLSKKKGRFISTATQYRLPNECSGENCIELNAPLDTMEIRRDRIDGLLDLLKIDEKVHFGSTNCMEMLQSTNCLTFLIVNINKPGPSHSYLSRRIRTPTHTNTTTGMS